MPAKLPWVAEGIYARLRTLESRREIRLVEIGVRSIDDFEPKSLLKLNLVELKAILKEFRTSGIVSLRAVPTKKPDVISMLIQCLQPLSENKDTYVNDEVVREYISRTDVPVTVNSAPIAAANPTPSVPRTLQLTYENRAALLAHITHLRRFRLATDPLHELVEPLAIEPFKFVSTNDRGKAEFRARKQDLMLTRPEANERILVRLFGERPAFVVQRDSITKETINPPVDLDQNTIWTRALPKLFTPGHIDPAFASQRHLRSHPGAHGNDPALGTSRNYPSESVDRAALRVLLHGVALPFKGAAETAVWVDARDDGIVYPEFKEKEYNSMHLNKHKKRAVPIMKSVDVTECVRRSVAARISIEVAMLRPSAEASWEGCIVIERVRERTEADIAADVQARPRVNPLPVLDDLDVEKLQRDTPRECDQCHVARPDLQRCSGCKIVYYCGSEHQRAAWPTHRLLCARVKQAVARKAERERIAAEKAAEAPDDLVVGEQLVSLCCPLSQARMTVPVKGLHCEHHQCFELSAFLAASRQQSLLQCPQCARRLPIQELSVSDQMDQACRAYPEDVTEVFATEGKPYQLAESTPPPPKRGHSAQPRPQQMVNLASATPAPIVEAPAEEIIDLD